MNKEKFRYQEVHKQLKRLGIYTPTIEPEHRILYDQAFYITSKRHGAILCEFGTLSGSTAITIGMAIEMAKALAKEKGEERNGSLTSVDNYMLHKKGTNARFVGPDTVRENIRNCELQGSVFIVEMDDLEYIERLDDRSVDFAWIDSAHTYDHVNKTLDKLMPKMAANSLITGHDYGIAGHEVIYAVEDFRARYAENLSGFAVHFKNWWCLVRKPITKKTLI